MAQSLSLSVPADAAYLKCIRGFIKPVLAKRFEEDQARQLVLAIDEACSNIIKHGQSWLRPKGRISVEVLDGKKKLEFKILNFCKERDVCKIKPRDLDDIKPGGLGTHFIQQVMDSVDFVPEGDRDGKVSMVLTKYTNGNGGKDSNETDD